MLSMKRKALTWSDVRVGLLIFVSLMIVVLGVFFVGPGRHLGGGIKVRSIFADVGGLTAGAGVRMSGVQVGTVTNIRFVNPADVPANRFLLRDLSALKNEMGRLNLSHLEAREKFQDDERRYADIQSRVKHIAVLMDISSNQAPLIRSDSVAMLKHLGLVGEKYVSITPAATPDSPQLFPVSDASGVTAIEVPSLEFPDINTVLGNASNLTASLADVGRQLDTDIKQGKGTIGKLFTDPSVHDNLKKTLQETAEATKYSSALLKSVKEGKGSIGKLFNDPSLYNATSSFIQSLSSSQGTMGKLIHDPSVYNNLNHMTEKMDELATQTAEGRGSFHQLLHDPALYKNTNTAMQQMTSLLQTANSNQGSLGKFIHDETLYKNSSQAMTDLAAVAEKINNGDGSLGLLIKDKKLYDNMTALSGELLLLIHDFRTNPKKYLTIHLNVIKLF